MYNPGASLHRLPRLRFWAVLCSLAVWGMGGVPQAFGQALSTCEPLLAEAEERYTDREYTEAEDLLRACLAQSELAVDEALRAYRLLALVFLRQDDVSEAKQAVLRLLGVSFSYEADPVQDPPVYVALVTSVKDQLRIDRDPPADGTGVDEPEVRVAQITPEPQEEAAPAEEQVSPQARNGFTRWLLIGGGVVVASVAGVLLTGGGSGDASGGTPLPLPPSFPR
jgi:hypothetical protein